MHAYLASAHACRMLVTIELAAILNYIWPPECKYMVCAQVLKFNTTGCSPSIDDFFFFSKREPHSKQKKKSGSLHV